MIYYTITAMAITLTGAIISCISATFRSVVFASIGLGISVGGLALAIAIQFAK